MVLSVLWVRAPRTERTLRTLRTPRTPRTYNPSVHRFYAPALDAGDDIVTLPRDEGEHLTRVLRLGAGDTVAVFDGRGQEFLARVVTAARRDVQLQSVSRVEAVAEPNVALT